MFPFHQFLSDALSFSLLIFSPLLILTQLRLTIIPYLSSLIYFQTSIYHILPQSVLSHWCLLTFPLPSHTYYHTSTYTTLPFQSHLTFGSFFFFVFHPFINTNPQTSTCISHCTAVTYFWRNTSSCPNVIPSLTLSHTSAYHTFSLLSLCHISVILLSPLALVFPLIHIL